MWKNYSAGFIKQNRASGISIMVAAFITATCLSFLCGLFYNIWRSEMDGIIREEGDWQGRITVPANEVDLPAILNFANVEKAVINEELAAEDTVTVDVIFHNARTIFQDMPLLLTRLGLAENAAEYHVTLLSRYLIHDPQDEEPPLLMSFYLVILVVLSVSLILIIHNSFALSMNVRIRQFGIFSSIGAAPGQIFTCLMQEAAMLCAVPILAGSLAGILLCFGAMQGVNVIAVNLPGWQEAVFYYHPAVLGITVLVSGLTVFFSAWLPARKLSRLTPLEAIRQIGGGQLKRKKRSRILSRLFGIEGKLAGNALKSQRKALRTSTLSLTLSFWGFTVMLCFFTLSGISTGHTYFEKYQGMWDVMVTVKDTKAEDFRLTEEIRGLSGVRDVVLYQKAVAVTPVAEDWQSEELKALGGYGAVADGAVPVGSEAATETVAVIGNEAAERATAAGNEAAVEKVVIAENEVAVERMAAAGIETAETMVFTETGAVTETTMSTETDGKSYWWTEAPIVILDNESFLKYCEQIGAASRLDGTIILNQIWDRLHSNFRYPKMIPFVREDRGTIALQANDYNKMAGKEAGELHEDSNGERKLDNEQNEISNEQDEMSSIVNKQDSVTNGQGNTRNEQGNTRNEQDSTRSEQDRVHNGQNNIADRQFRPLVEIPVLAYTVEAPVLREEYDRYSLVQFIPLSLWQEIAGQIGGAEDDAYIRVLAREGVTTVELNELEEKIVQIAGRVYEIESENRIEEKSTNDRLVSAYMLLLGGFCILLAVIGIANVFSNTLGFLTRRKQELARYISVGMTPAGIRKMFCIEVLIIAGRPLFITLPLTVLFVQFAVTASYLNPAEFWAVAPVMPIAIFGLAIFGFVALAYYIGGRKVFRYDLVDILRNDALG